MSSTPQSHPSVQRLNKAYVQVPASPLSLSRLARSTPAHVVASSKLKENTPLRPSLLAMSQHASSSTSLKRKYSDRDTPSQVMDGVVLFSKKSRMSMDASTSLKARQVEPPVPLSNATEEFPNGWVYCHQCNKKRDVTDTVRCTVMETYKTIKDKNLRERLCVSKYCKWCLKNRYDEDINNFKPQLGRNGAVYSFKCPRCMDTCNCPRCRKSKGLEAVGFIPKEKSKTSEPLSKGNKPKVPSMPSAKAKEPAKVKAKLLPRLKWTPLPINLTQEEADERICIREFALRFGDFLDPVPAKSHIEELEFIGGRQRKQDDDSDTTNWVSDMCIRSLLVSILGLLAKSSEVELAKIIKSSVKEIKACGNNLNKIWIVMASLRDELTNATSTGDIPLTFPDPSAPSIVQSRSLRSLADNLVAVVHSTQMIPVLLSLIQLSLETSIIREEIDQGVKDARDFGHDARIATKIENERWEKERTTMEVATKDKAQKIENRDKRAAHKLQITNIENALRIIGPSFSPRVTTLGTDTEGRIYYVFSPGMAERESAVEYLELAASDKLSKPRKRIRVLSPEDRSELREWSWFVAVWGKRPPSAFNTSLPRRTDKLDDGGSDSRSDDEDEDMEKWWGFWEVDEILKLAQWICIKSGIEDDETISNGEGGSLSSPREKSLVPPRIAQLKRLSTGLKDYAALLNWRVRDDKTTLINRTYNGSQTPFEETSSRGKIEQSEEPGL